MLVVIFEQSFLFHLKLSNFKLNYYFFTLPSSHFCLLFWTPFFCNYLCFLLLFRCAALELLGSPLFRSLLLHLFTCSVIDFTWTRHYFPRAFHYCSLLPFCSLPSVHSILLFSITLLFFTFAHWRLLDLPLLSISFSLTIFAFHYFLIAVFALYYLTVSTFVILFTFYFACYVFYSM